MERKRLLFVFVLMAIMLVMATGCTPVAGTQTPAGTPAPSGQINLPGLSIQVYLPGPNLLVNTPDSHDRVASVLLGIWHGFISPVTLVISFFNTDVQMYEVHNDGSLYNLGFFIGVAIVFIILGALIGGSPRRAR